MTKKTTGTVEDHGLLTFTEVMRRTGVSRPTISRACSSGELGCVRFGVRAVRVPAKALQDFINTGGISFTPSSRARKARRS